MSKRNPRLTGKDLLGFLQKNGFVIVRIKGSHHFLRHADGRTTVIPVHSGEYIGPGLLNKISKDTDIPVKDFKLRRVK